VERTCRRVLDVAGRLLKEQGATAVTFDRVSREAGVSRTTLYRHWPRPVDLLVDSYRQLTEAPMIEPTQHLAADLTAMLATARDGLRDGAWTRALPSLIEAAEGDQDLAALHADFTDRRREPMLQRLRTAVTHGDLPAHVDLDWLCDALISPLFYRRYHRHVATPDAYLARHVQHCLTATGRTIAASSSSSGSL
jgi:AcrR family transcriptional regulator